MKVDHYVWRAERRVEQQQPRAVDQKAQMALGIAQTESWNGVSWIPKLGAALDQQDRRDRQEDVLAEEQSDIVGRGGHGLHAFARLFVELAMLFSAAASAMAQERAHRLGMPATDVSPSAASDLANSEIDISSRPVVARRICRSAFAPVPAGRSARGAR